MRLALLLSCLSLSGAAFAAEVLAPNVHVGDAALLFSLPAINEEAAMKAVARTHVALSDFTGVTPGFPAKAVVLHFCNRKGGEAELQALNRLNRKYNLRGIRFIAILDDNADIATLSEWVGDQKLDFPVLHDPHRIVIGRYGITHTPTTFVIRGSLDSSTGPNGLGDLGSGDIEAVGIPGADIEASLETLLAPFLE